MNTKDLYIALPLELYGVISCIYSVNLNLNVNLPMNYSSGSFKTFYPF